MDDARTQLQNALKEAMRNRDTVRRDVIRMTLNAIKQTEIDRQQTLSTEDASAILQKEAKKRRESIEEMRQAGRDDLADQEQQELDILETFLPAGLSHDELVALVSDAIAQTGATSMNDVGKVMGALMPEIKGRADGSTVNQIVREKLR